MIAEIVENGNSKGIKISEVDIQNLFPNGQINVIINNNNIELLPINSIRHNWDKLFKDEKSDLVPLIEVSNKFDEEEWEW